jgi:hypothetical protein
MQNKPIETTAPPGSRIATRLDGAYFYDAWRMPASNAAQAQEWAQRSALELFMLMARRTPRWVNACMSVRNGIVQMLGLKNLGHLAELTADKPAAAYRQGDRVGIFTLIEQQADEVLLGDSDKHLDVVLSLHRRTVLLAAEHSSGNDALRDTAGAGATPPAKLQPEPQTTVITMTTVVHAHNLLGRIYMLPVRPMHRLIAPAGLASLARTGVGG